MILMFAGIIAGIVIGVVLSLLVAVVIWREETSDFDLDELIHDLEPDETPVLSDIIQRHREAHLSARREEEE